MIGPLVRTKIVFLKQHLQIEQVPNNPVPTHLFINKTDHEPVKGTLVRFLLVILISSIDKISFRTRIVILSNHANWTCPKWPWQAKTENWLKSVNRSQSVSQLNPFTFNALALTGPNASVNLITYALWMKTNQMSLTLFNIINRFSLKKHATVCTIRYHFCL